MTAPSGTTSSTKRLLGASVLAAVSAYAAGVIGWSALANALPGIASTLLPSAVATAIVVGVFRTVGRLGQREAAAIAAGFFLVHLVFWLVFATRTGLAHVTTGSECGTSSLGDLFSLSDNKPDCDFTGNTFALFVFGLALLPVIGLLVGFGIRAALPDPSVSSVPRERTF